jgi:hypothetical protein
MELLKSIKRITIQLKYKKFIELVKKKKRVELIGRFVM